LEARAIKALVCACSGLSPKRRRHQRGCWPSAACERGRRGSRPVQIKEERKRERERTQGQQLPVSSQLARVSPPESMPLCLTSPWLHGQGCRGKLSRRGNALRGRDQSVPIPPKGSPGHRRRQPCPPLLWRIHHPISQCARKGREGKLQECPGNPCNRCRNGLGGNLP